MTQQEQPTPPEPEDALPAPADLSSLSNEEIQAFVDRLQSRRMEVEQQNRSLRTALSQTRYQLLRRQEEERAALARTLHGGPIQELSSLLFELNFLQQTAQDEESKTRVLSLKENLMQAIQHLRQLIDELRPATLAHFGLQAAVRAATEKFQQANTTTKIALFINAEETILAEERALACYRILQQALRNVAQHAQAENVIVRLVQEETLACLEIEDDGVGFPAPTNWDDLAQREQSGLAIAWEQAETFGGTFTVRSTPGQGTLVRATLPR